MTGGKKEITLNSQPGTLDPSAATVRLRKPHPCGGAEFTVIRVGPVVTLRCKKCASFVRLSRERFEKSLKNEP